MIAIFLYRRLLLYNIGYFVRCYSDTKGKDYAL